MDRKQPLRVLHVIPSVGPLRGGPSVMIEALGRALAEAGCRVDVATTDDNGPGRLAVACRVPLKKGSVTYWHFRRNIRFYTLSWSLTRWLARHVADYDIVHIHALFSYPSVASAWWAHRRHVPYVVRPLGTLGRWALAARHPRLKRWSLRLVESRILRWADAVHFTTEQERIDASHLVPAGTSVVIPNPVEALGVPPPHLGDAFRARYPGLQGRKVVLFLSRLDPKKGLDLLLAAFARLLGAGADAVLVIAGAGPAVFCERMRREAERLGIAPRVVWTGFLAGEDKLGALAAADVFVLPSYEENFGIAAVEAMSCGVPVVTSDRVGIHPEVKRGEAGLVTPCDEEALSAALNRILTDEHLQGRLGSRGRKLARSHFSVDAVSARVLELYESLVGGGLY